MVNILDYQEKCNRESKPNLKKFFHFLKKKYILSRIKLNERMYSKKSQSSVCMASSICFGSVFEEKRSKT